LSSSGKQSEVDLLTRAFETAVAAAQPGICLRKALEKIDSPTPAVVIGAGKAAASMAACFHEVWPAASRGLVVTRYEHGLAPDESAGAIEVIEAGHPSPDSASIEAGRRLVELAGSVRDDEQLYWLVSGGGSALAAAPLAPATFEQKRAAANFLMHSGADIREINCVRKHLSGIKGGRLAAAAHPRPVHTFAISDVPGDDIAAIASGPTIADPTTQQQALDVLQKYAYPDIDELRIVLEDPAFESPKPGTGAFANDTWELIATADTALAAARRLLEEHGYVVEYLGDDLDDEARALGNAHAAMALEALGQGRRVAILSGGETRVVIRQKGGRGGRNLEYLAGVAEGLGAGEGAGAGVFALAADTDGIDGHGGHAGAWLRPGDIAAARSRGVELAECQDANDCYRFFEATDALIMTGPTRTNVNDFRLILCQS
jgi:hydroxypyruvate reductase